jgi:hypothetical protein
MRGNLNLPFEAPSCDVSFPYSSDRLVKEVNTKDDVGLKGGYPARFAKLPMWELTMHA